MGDIKSLYETKKAEIKNKLEQFKKLSTTEYKKEFVFCLLTPQSNAQRCWRAVEEIFGKEKFDEISLKEILKTKTRFHNTKAKRVVNNLKKWGEVKNKISNCRSIELRNWLAENINGYGLKEASHFVRNIGKSDDKIAILDRHILRNLKSNSIIYEEKIKSKKHYLEIEKKYLDFSEKI